MVEPLSADHQKNRQTRVLVHHFRDWYSSAAVDFGWVRGGPSRTGGRRENTRCGLRPTSNKAPGQNPRSPSGWGGTGASPRCRLVK
jgi:hypothetical protein